MSAETQSLDTRKVEAVNRYATPLAVLVVTAGIVLTQPVSPVKEISIGLLIFGILFNVLTAKFITRKEHPLSWLLPFRLYVNLAANTLLVYYLGAFFGPVWLLLTLTPMATAIYGSRRQTLTAAVTAAAILLAVQAFRPDNSLIDWGQRVVQSGYICLMSLLANTLVSLREEKP